MKQTKDNAEDLDCDVVDLPPSWRDPKHRFCRRRDCEVFGEGHLLEEAVLVSESQISGL
jgi:hypothetical protein